MDDSNFVAQLLVVTLSFCGYCTLLLFCSVCVNTVILYLVLCSLLMVIAILLEGLMFACAEEGCFYVDYVVQHEGGNCDRLSTPLPL